MTDEKNPDVVHFERGMSIVIEPGKAPAWALEQTKLDPAYNLELREHDRANDYTDMTLDVRKEGCVHIRRYWNGSQPGDGQGDANVCYIHICELDRFIGVLQEAKAKAIAAFGEDWGR